MHYTGASEANGHVYAGMQKDMRGGRLCGKLYNCEILKCQKLSYNHMKCANARKMRYVLVRASVVIRNLRMLLGLTCANGSLPRNVYKC